MINEEQLEKTLAEKATASVLAKQERLENLAGQQSRTLKKKLKFLEVFADQAHGVITIACNLAGIKSRRTVYNWIESDPDFKQAMEDTNEIQYDFVHDLYIAQIARGNPRMIRHYLDHRHPAYKRRKSHGDIEWLKKYGHSTDLPDWYNVPKGEPDV